MRKSYSVEELLLVQLNNLPHSPRSMETTKGILLTTARLEVALDPAPAPAPPASATTSAYTGLADIIRHVI